MSDQLTAQRDAWHAQWSMFHDDEEFLFTDWIAPATLDDFRGRDVLECGCGGGQHTAIVSRVARSVTAVDRFTTEIARARNPTRHNVRFVEADIATMDLGGRYDIVICIGVIHHTDDPTATFENLYRHCRPGGSVIVWTYSAEGNGLVRYLVEPIRQGILRFLPKRAVASLSSAITALLYPLVYSVYGSPLFAWLPYYEYFGNFRKLSFRRNMLNVFDKLNAPQTHWIDLATCRAWLNSARFVEETISIRPYKGVSYSLVGTKRHDT